MTRRERIGKWLVLLGLFVFGFTLYSSVLLLPNIYDTLLHIRINGGLNWGNVWLPTEAFGFFRPNTFTPMLLVRAIFGHYPPTILNLINLTQHALNGILLTTLLYRLTQNQQQAIITGLLFLVFPFSYQAVAVYGHNVHPQVVFMLLAGLHGLVKKGNKIKVSSVKVSHWIFVGTIFILGLLTHESFVLFGPFAFLIALHQLNSPNPFPKALQNLKTLAPSSLGDLATWRSILLSFLLTFAGTAYIILYQFLPIGRAPQAIAEAGSLWQKILYLLQALTYPLTWFGHWLPNVGAQTIILLAFAITLLLTALAWRSQWRTLLLGWGWWGLASLLLAIPLPAGYLLNGPRLLYLGSVGIVIIWSAFLTALSARGRWFKLLTAFLFAWLVSTNVVFVRGRLAAYHELTQGVDRLRSAKTEAVVLVNLPQWLAPTTNTYPLGAEFVQQLGDYLFVEEWVEHNLQRSLPTVAVRVDELLGQVAYGYGVHNQAGWDVISAEWTAHPSDIYITRYTKSGTEFEYVGRFTPIQHTETLATFDSYTLHAASAFICDDDLRLTTVWAYAAGTPPPATVSIFAQLLDNNGVLVSQNDRAPLGLPTYKVALPTGWQMVDVRVLENSAESLPTILNGQILLGVYDYTTGNREAIIPATSDNAFSVPITHCR